MAKYLLSIVIPTRNRQIYAIESVKQIYNVTDERVQIVVQDNSDDNSLQKKIAEFSDCSRIKYSYTEKRIPGVENYAKGIENSEGEYVLCIGDDDGVLRYVVEVVEWASKNNIKAIKPGIQAMYFWPGVSPKMRNGNLYLYRCSDTISRVNPQKELEKLVKNGGQGYLDLNLVKAYHGIVRKEFFDDVLEKTGHYCGGLSPDMYFCTALSLIIDEVVCLGIPLSIGGVCKASTSGDSVNKTNFGPLESAPHFIGQEYGWSSKVPRYYCGETIWADTMLHALAEMKADKYIREFSIEKLTCCCLEKNHGFEEEIFDNFNRNNGNYALLNEYRNYKKNSSLSSKVLKVLLKFRFPLLVFEKDNVEGIVRAEEIISKKLRNKVSGVCQNIKQAR